MLLLSGQSSGAIAAQPQMRSASAARAPGCARSRHARHWNYVPDEAPCFVSWTDNGMLANMPHTAEAADS